ncbi:hypothetical protein [Actinoplanes aureus]|uniref:Uncharacterized protein n=1 Tax=Actinoplanes aureus TaxID=2792083 RepID=A0A931C7Z7_9ACTN|nr:hypothetical protein [Actinoplanes aureus]MBG0561168.1 hypothetical protein [Actinoplanes aureus]
MSSGGFLSRLLALVPTVALLCACAPEPQPWTDIGERCPELTVPAFAAVSHGTLLPWSGAIGDVYFGYCRYGSESDPAGFTAIYTIDRNPRHERYWDGLAESTREQAEGDVQPFVTLPDVGVPALAVVNEEVIEATAWSRNASVVAAFGDSLTEPAPTQPQLTARAGDLGPLLRDLVTGLHSAPLTGS